MGRIVILSKNNILVSNNCNIDIIMDIIDTEEGRKAKNIKVFEIKDYFGSVVKYESIEFAYRNDDEEKISGTGIVSKITANKCIIEILENNNNYQQLIRRAKAWQV